MVSKRLQITYILTFPAVLTVGILLIPIVKDYADHGLAEQAVAKTGRWLGGHTLAAVGFALAILAVSVIDRHLQLKAKSLPVFTLPCISIGAGLYAVGLGADGLGPAAVYLAGYSPIIFFDGSSILVPAIFVAGTLVFGLGLFGLVRGSIYETLLQGWQRPACISSALIFVVAPAIPSGWALYGVAMASFGICVPFVLAISNNNLGRMGKVS